MFTGLIEDVGQVVSLQKENGAVLKIKAALGRENLQIGQSVAVNGSCLTVVGTMSDMIVFEISPETLRATALGDLGPGSIVNLERALCLGDRLGGHLVTGHVDGVGQLVRMAPEGLSRIMSFSMPKHLVKYVVRKGSIAVDGVSLTVNSVDVQSFSVAVIPHTWEKTNLQAKKINDRVNLETDLIGKYVESLMSERSEQGLTKEILNRAGYTKKD